MGSVAVSSLEIIFGLSSIFGFTFAVFIHFRKKATISTLLERLRGARCNLIQMNKQVGRIVHITEMDDAEMEPKEKIKSAMQVAKAIYRTNEININAIDNGIEWAHLSQKEILKTIE